MMEQNDIKKRSGKAPRPGFRRRLLGRRFAGISLVLCLVFTWATEASAATGWKERLIAEGSRKLAHMQASNVANTKAGRWQGNQYVLQLDAGQDTTGKVDQHLIHEGDKFVSDAKLHELNKTLSEVARQSGISCYLVLISDIPIRIELDQEDDAVSIFQDGPARDRRLKKDFLFAKDLEALVSENLFRLARSQMPGGKILLTSFCKFSAANKTGYNLRLLLYHTRQSKVIHQITDFINGKVSTADWGRDLTDEQVASKFVQLVSQSMTTKSAVDRLTGILTPTVLTDLLAQFSQSDYWNLTPAQRMFILRLLMVEGNVSSNGQGIALNRQIIDCQTLSLVHLARDKKPNQACRKVSSRTYRKKNGVV